MPQTIMHRAFFILLLGIACLTAFRSASAAPASTLASTAASPTTATAVNDSPKTALKAYNAAMRDGDVAEMVALQHATNEDQRRVARACAQSDLEVGRLIKAARDKFGDEAAKKVGQAVNDEGDDEIDAAEETVNGNEGGVKFAGSPDPSPMIKVKGQWLVDISGLLKQYSGTPDQLADSIIRRGSVAKVTTQEVLSGQQASVDSIVQVLKDRLKDE